MPKPAVRSQLLRSVRAPALDREELHGTQNQVFDVWSFRVLGVRHLEMLYNIFAMQFGTCEVAYDLVRTAIKRSTESFKHILVVVDPQ